MTSTTFRSTLMVAILALSAVTGCTQDQMSSKQNWGTVGGAATGAVIGSQFGKGDGRVAAAAVGTLLGAFVGNQIGASLDRADQAAASQAYNQAYNAPVGQTVRWNNPQSGNSGTVTTTRDGYSQSGYYCREFQQKIIVGGKTEQAVGTACRNPDGTWQVQQ